MSSRRAVNQRAGDPVAQALSDERVGGLDGRRADAVVAALDRVVGAVDRTLDHDRPGRWAGGAEVLFTRDGFGHD